MADFSKFESGLLQILDAERKLRFAAEVHVNELTRINDQMIRSRNEEEGNRAKIEDERIRLWNEEKKKKWPKI